MAVFHLVLATLFGACLANLCAQAAERLGKFAPSCHIAGGKTTNLRAIHVQPDATGHTFNVFFLQARSGTVVALGGTGITGIDA